jgi:hypothetical protein
VKRRLLLWWNYWATQRHRPSYVSRYDWWLAPWVTTAQWVLQRRTLCCGLKKPHHKMACSRR